MSRLLINYSSSKTKTWLLEKFVWNNYIRNLTFKSRRKHFEFRTTPAALRSPIKLALCGWISCKWILFCW